MVKDAPNKISFLSRLKSFLTKKNVLIVALILLLIFQYWQSKNTSSNFSFLHSRESSLIDEIGQLKETYMKVGSDLNEVRAYLRLPTTNYQEIESIISGDSEDNNTDQVQLALFKYIDSLASAYATQKKITFNKALIDNLLVSKDFSAFLVKEGLAFVPDASNKNNIVVKINDKQGDPLIIYTFNGKTGDLSSQTVDAKEEVEADSFSEFKEDLMKFLTDNKADLTGKIQTIKNFKGNIINTINSDKVQKIVKEKGLSFSPDFVQKDLTMTYSIFNKANEVTGEIVIDMESSEVSLVDKNDEDRNLVITDIMMSLPAFLTDLDARTFVEKKAAEGIESFQKTLKDKGFKLLLSNADLYFSDAQEENNRIIYKLYDGENKLVSTFAIEKATGVITITDDSGRKDENLLFFDSELKKKS
jgi:3-methyladenine DNA glycosylase Tag